MSDQTPPHDLNLEACVIASVLIDPSVLPLVSPIISPEDFYAPRHYEVWRALLAVAAQGLPLDAPTIAGHLKATGRLEKAGGASVFADLLMATATTANAEGYATLVRRYAVTRRIMAEAQRILSAGSDANLDHEAFASDARSAIGSACDGAVRDTNCPQRLDAELARLFRDLESGEEPQGLVSTGIPAIDATIGGLWPGLVHLIAARPSMGKSCLGLNIATNAALAGRKVLLFSMEDVRYFIAIRLLGRFSDVDTQSLTRRKLPMDAFPQVVRGLQKCSNLPLWVDDSGSLSTAQIRAKVLRHRDKEGLDLLVIDHLAEITERGEGETQIVSRAMQGVRDLTKELGVPTLLLHQLNRKVEDRVSKVPILSDLKQSGKVEEAARMVGFLCRQGYYDGDNSRRDLQLHIAKANHGQTGMVRLWCDLSRMFIRGWEASDGEFPSQSGENPRSPKKQAAEWRGAEDKRAGYDY